MSSRRAATAYVSRVSSCNFFCYSAQKFPDIRETTSAADLIPFCRKTTPPNAIEDESSVVGLVPVPLRRAGKPREIYPSTGGGCELRSRSFGRHGVDLPSREYTRRASVRRRSATPDGATTISGGRFARRQRRRAEPDVIKRLVERRAVLKIIPQRVGLGFCVDATARRRSAADGRIDR